MSSERVTPERKRTPKLPAKFRSVSTSRSYPGTCGFAVSDQIEKEWERHRSASYRAPTRRRSRNGRSQFVIHTQGPVRGGLGTLSPEPRARDNKHSR